MRRAWKGRRRTKRLWDKQCKVKDAERVGKVQSILYCTSIRCLFKKKTYTKVLESYLNDKNVHEPNRVL